MSLKEKLRVYKPQDFPRYILVEPIAVLEYYYLCWISCSNENLDGDLLAGKFDERILSSQLAGLLRCYKSPVMCNAWKEVKSIFPGAPAAGQMWFAEALYSSFMINQDQYMTATDVKDWKNHCWTR